MKLQLSKIMIFIKILNIIQILAVIVLIFGRVFMDIDFVGASIIVNRDFLLVFLVLVVIINLFAGSRDMKLLSNLSGRLDSQLNDIENVNKLNNTLRAQRHDFLNHVQIIYGLLELEEHEEAKGYMDTLYSQIKQTGKSLKTSQPAINALIRAKMVESEEKDIIFVFDTNTKLEDITIEVWELCRIIGNLIDNAIYATLEYPSKSYIRVRIIVNKESLLISVENAGYPIDEKMKHKMFVQGVTTKSEDASEHGLGLHIVKELVQKNKGNIVVTCENYMTKFTIDFSIK